VFVLSQYIETRYAARLLEGNAAGVGYLLKDRVAEVAEFASALERVAAGGTAWTPKSSASSSGPAGTPAGSPN
jgi:DNA-binding NarL/FixJ family response regulator